MNKKDIAIISLSIALILMISIFSYFYFIKYKVITQNNLKTATECTTIETNYIRDACLMKAAAIEYNPKTCDNISDDYERDLCYTRISKLLNNETICDSIGDKRYSRPKCYGEIAIIRTGSL